MSPICSRVGLVALTLALAAAPAARGQQPPGDPHPLDAKEKARALHQSQKGEPEALRRSLRDVALTAYHLRLRQVRNGTLMPDFAFHDLVRLVAADSALARTPAEHLAALARYWAGWREIDLLTAERVAAGIKQFTSADAWAAHTEHLLAELRLVRELAEAREQLPGVLHLALDDPDPFEDRGVVRAEFGATRVEPRRLARAALDACNNEHATRSKRIQAGTDTPDVFLPMGDRRLAAARAAGANPAEYLAAVEAVWMLNRDLERLTLERVEAGIKQFTPADYYETRDHRLEASVLMAEARGGAGKPLPLQGGLQDPVAPLLDAPLDTKDAARAKFEATRADVRQLTLERRAAILAANQFRPELWNEISKRLLDVEQALARGKADHVEALERHLARVAEIEALTRERIETGIKQFTPADFWEARYDRILAELWLAEARAARE
jgi:hypothetical protein